MKTLRPRVKNYFISLALLTLLFLLTCIPLFLGDFISTTLLISIMVAALTGHLIASLPISPNLFSFPPKKVKPSPIPVNSNGVSTLYVGNLLYRTKRDDLIEIFGKFGDVISARIILDKDSRKSKGYGFVEMATGDAITAVEALNGSDFNGRALRVNEAKGR